MKTLIAIAGAAIILTAVFLTMQHQAQIKLQQQNDALQKQIDQLAQLKTENQQLTDQLAEANKSSASFKEQLNMVSAKEQAAAKTSPATSTSSAPPVSKPTENVLPKDSWSKAGFATPEDTLKTRGWAVLSGDREQFAQSISLTDGARKMIEDQLVQMAAASKDPDTQNLLQEALNEKWGAEEAILMPMMAANQNNPFTGYKILSENSPSADEMILQVETETASAPAQTETLDFQRFGTDWKIVYDKTTIQNMMQSH